MGNPVDAAILPTQFIPRPCVTGPTEAYLSFAHLGPVCHIRGRAPYFGAFPWSIRAGNVKTLAEDEALLEFGDVLYDLR
jgi:hypothetical protein